MLPHQLLEAYSVRPCWLCGVVGPCLHREPEVEAAFMEARPLPPAKKPPNRASDLETHVAIPVQRAKGGV
jgi:hypothetical protein